MPLRIFNLASGSKANSTLVQHGNSAILIDCGLSHRQTNLRLLQLGVDPAIISGILVTHEHTDHIKGASRCSRLFETPVFATPGTISAGGLACLDHQAVRCGQEFNHGKFCVHTLAVSHDTAEPCAFVVEVAGTRILFATDLGTTEGLDHSALKNLDYLYVEANHDLSMLRNGPYPYFLKKRIAGVGGHLENEQCGEFIKGLAGQSPGLKGIMLGHLSEKNNDPQVALDTVRMVAGALPGVNWAVARQDVPSGLHADRPDSSSG